MVYVVTESASTADIRAAEGVVVAANCKDDCEVWAYEHSSRSLSHCEQIGRCSLHFTRRLRQVEHPSLDREVLFLFPPACPDDAVTFEAGNGFWEVEAKLSAL